MFKLLHCWRFSIGSHRVTPVAMEAAGVYWKPVRHLLEGDFALILANAQHIRNVPGRKSDVSDAGWIADSAGPPRSRIPCAGQARGIHFPSAAGSVQTGLSCGTSV